MWVEAVLSKDDLASLIEQIVPLTIRINADTGADQYIEIASASNLALVADQGLRMTAEAEIHWPVLGITVPIKIDSLSVMIKPQITTAPGGGDALSFALQIEQAEFAGILALGDQPITDKINSELGKIDLAWAFATMLSHQFKMPTMLEPLDSLALKVAWGKVGSRRGHRLGDIVSGRGFACRPRISHQPGCQRKLFGHTAQPGAGESRSPAPSSGHEAGRPGRGRSTGGGRSVFHGSERGPSRGEAASPRLQLVTSRRGRRWVRTLAFVFVGVLLAYPVAANLVLALGGVQKMFEGTNQVKVDFRRAWSFWPGHVHVEGVRLIIQIGTSSSLSTWPTRTRYSTFDLVHRTLHATKVRGDGVVFRFRHRIQPESADAPFVAALPPSPNSRTRLCDLPMCRPLLSTKLTTICGPCTWRTWTSRCRSSGRRCFATRALDACAALSACGRQNGCGSDRAS